MVEQGKKYVRKDTKQGKVVADEVVNGRVEFHHVGYFDARSCPIELFESRYELETDIQGEQK